MKYIAYLLGMAAAIHCLASCDDASPYLNSEWKLSVNTRYLNIDKTDVAFGANQNLTQTLNVSSVSTAWRLSDGDAWISASPASGNSDAVITLTATENTSGDDIRTCIMNFASAETDFTYSRPVSITQGKAAAYITPNQQTVSFSRDASTQSVVIASNIKWEARCGASWVTLRTTDDGKTLNIAVEENNSTTERTATIHIEGNSSATITVVQAGSRFDDLVASLYFGNKASSQEITIETDGNWSATTDAGWLSLSPGEGKGKTVLKISVTDNKGEDERVGRISVTVGNQTKTILVTQAGTYFTVDSSSSDVIPASGGQHVISFVSSDKWTAHTNSDWVTLQPASGEKGKSTLTIMAKENKEIKARTDTTYIIPENDNLQPYRIITKQEGIGYHLRTDKTLISIGSEAAKASLSIISNDKWTAASSADWVTLSATSGDGNGFVEVTIAENTYPEKRQGQIAIKGENCETIIVDVIQSGIGYHLSVSKNSLSVGGSGIVTSFSIISNDSWTVSPSVSWISVSPASGMENQEITVTVDASNEPEERTGIITITGKNSITEIVRLTQEGIGYQLSVAPTSIVIGAAASSKSFTITSNDAWEITSSVGWASVSTSSGIGTRAFFVEFDANEDPEARTGTISVNGVHTPEVTIALRQEGVGYHVSVDKSTIDVWAAATTETFSITSNDSWTISSSASWVIPSQTAGSGNLTISLSIERNTYIEERSAAITIRGTKSGQTLTLTVLQAGGGQNDITIEDFEDPIPLN